MLFFAHFHSRIFIRASFHPRISSTLFIRASFHPRISSTLFIRAFHPRIFH
jgi:hypothetical protein